MLEIRAAQFQAFRQNAEKDFRRRLARRLARVTSQTESEIEANIESGLRLASDCGLKREIDVARLVEAVCVHLGGFPADGLPRAALPILYAYGLSPERKLDQFLSWCEVRHG